MSHANYKTNLSSQLDLHRTGQLELSLAISGLFSIQVQYKVNKHKKQQRPGSSRGWNFEPLGSECRLKNPDQLLSIEISLLTTVFLSLFQS